MGIYAVCPVLLVRCDDVCRSSTVIKVASTSGSLENAACRGRRLWCTEQQCWIQEWHNIIFSDKSWFCVHYSDGPIRAWRLQGDFSSLSCIWYWYRGPKLGVRVYVATTHVSIVRIDGNLNANQCISDILFPVVTPYLRGQSNVIFQQDNTRQQVALCGLTFLDTLGICLFRWPALSSDLSPIENI
ncbi:transposable element Tcb1 transposase [Trichonephila clavipes]|nr:transposable element Tcb1 transposase [Trichonephila clavipes]